MGCSSDAFRVHICASPLPYLHLLSLMLLCACAHSAWCPRRYCKLVERAVVPVHPLTCRVGSNKLLNLSEFWFPYLQNRSPVAYFIGLIRSWQPQISDVATAAFRGGCGFC